MTTEHTPGPWRIRENARHSQEECDLTICGDIWQLADINGPQYDHQLANAHLIAASPELLTQLEWAESVLKWFIEGSAQLESLRATIAKAKGAS